MKMLRFAMGVTRKDIRNEYIRGTVKVRNEDEGRQVEVLWRPHEERPGVRWKKSNKNGVTRKEEKREAKEKIYRCSEGRYGKVGERETDIEKRTLWRNNIHCGYP